MRQSCSQSAGNFSIFRDLRPTRKIWFQFLHEITFHPAASARTCRRSPDQSRAIDCQTRSRRFTLTGIGVRSC